MTVPGSPIGGAPLQLSSFAPEVLKLHSVFFFPREIVSGVGIGGGDCRVQRPAPVALALSLALFSCVEIDFEYEGYGSIADIS